VTTPAIADPQFNRDVSGWHRTDMPPLLSDVRCWGQSGKHLLAASISPFDPTATFAVHCGNGFDADITPIKKSFKPIQWCLQSMGTDMQGHEFTTLISGAREVLIQKLMLIAVVGMSPSSR
jgi:hypothetical protein